MAVNRVGPPCPECNHSTTKVIKTYRDELNNIVRRRSCMSCSHRFYSAQLAELPISPYEVRWEDCQALIKWSSFEEPLLTHLHRSINEA